MKSLIAYMLLKSESNTPFHTVLQTLLPNPNTTNQNQNHVGFIFCERLVNMPVQIIPPMYRMLTDEIKWAIDDVSRSGYSSLPVHLIEFLSGSRRVIERAIQFLAPPIHIPHVPIII
jgi:hypothetical protein